MADGSDHPHIPSPGRAPTSVDEHVGRVMRTQRKRLGLSQERLADALGITFQQVQKYERGTNRVSASKLYQAAEVLNLQIGAFFPTQDGQGAALPLGPAIEIEQLRKQAEAPAVNGVVMIDARLLRNLLAELAGAATDRRPTDG